MFTWTCYSCDIKLFNKITKKFCNLKLFFCCFNFGYSDCSIQCFGACQMSITILNKSDCHVPAFPQLESRPPSNWTMRKLRTEAVPEKRIVPIIKQTTTALRSPLASANNAHLVWEWSRWAYDLIRFAPLWN